MQKSKKKSTIVVISVLAVLAIGVAVLAVLNGKNAAAKKQQLSEEYFVITADEMEYKVTAEEYLSLGPREFEANYKKNGKDPETRTYTGVPFAEVLQAKGVDPAGFGSVVFAAADGYVSPIPIEKALDEENCFIVFDDGGDGPFRMILAKDQFSQNWCKLLTDVTLK